MASDGMASDPNPDPSVGDLATLDQLLKENAEKAEALAVMGVAPPTVFELRLKLETFIDFMFTRLHGPVDLPADLGGGVNSERRTADLLFNLEYAARMAVSLDDALIKARKLTLTRGTQGHPSGGRRT